MLTGGPAEDQIHGGGGNDIITGGPGDDLLHGDLNWAPDQRSYDVSVPGDGFVFAAKDAHGTTLSGGAGEDAISTAQDTKASGGVGHDTFELGIGRGKKVDRVRGIAGGGGRDEVRLTSYTGGKNRYDLTIHVPKRRIDVGGGRFAKVAGTEEFVVEATTDPGWWCSAAVRARSCSDSAGS